MKYILMMYVTLIPTIIAGIMNMIWCKSSILKKIQTPIDGGKYFMDEKRIFGDNKTWKGILGYLIFNIIASIFWGIICNFANLNNYNFFYVQYENTFTYNLLIGLLLGTAYSIFELPNSFLKRRLGIEPGKTTTGFKKIFFIILDQADSIFGIALVVWLFYPIGIKIYLLFIVLGTITHLLINMMLYFLHLRKNMF